MKKTLGLVVFLVVLLVVLFVMLASIFSSVDVEASGCPTADRILFVIPEEQPGQTPECDGIENCVMACFLLPEVRGRWEMECFPWSLNE